MSKWAVWGQEEANTKKGLRTNMLWWLCQVLCTLRLLNQEYG